MTDFALLESTHLISNEIYVSDRKSMKFPHCGRIFLLSNFFSKLFFIFPTVLLKTSVAAP